MKRDVEKRPTAWCGTCTSARVPVECDRNVKRDIGICKQTWERYLFSGKLPVCLCVRRWSATDMSNEVHVYEKKRGKERYSVAEKFIEPPSRSVFHVSFHIYIGKSLLNFLRIFLSH